MSSVERNNPPPRRKSCDACRAAKRRCNLALPACFRCTRRNMACVYPGLPAPDQMPELLELLTAQDVPDASCVEQFSFAAPPVVALGHDSDPLSQGTAPVVFLDDHHELIPVRSGAAILRSELMSSRFQYAMDTLKDTPRMMVEENQAPWSHAQLYRTGMPKAMQDAYACCALYITKNAINAPIIASLIHSRHQDLTLSPLPATPPDLLAHIQALLLYQIMQLFDSDLHATTCTSSLNTLSMSALESAATLLLTGTHFPQEQATPSPLPPSPTPFWTLWTFEESARRTILFTFYFLQILRLTRGEQSLKCHSHLGQLHSWYFSAYLWNASSAQDFAAAWAERAHYIVHNVNFEKVLREAQPGDVDCLGRMMLVTSQGVERVREWFFTRGAIL
ncbi:hypothetical protein BDW62DRAFT_217265 [Aspergillus aurantiobrunneus]